jgi:hypothetical protein
VKSSITEMYKSLACIGDAESNIMKLGATC